MITEPMTRVLLVDDQLAVRVGLRDLLSAYPDIEVVGTAANGEEALCSMEAMRPHVLIMNISLLRMNGFAGAREIQKRYPDLGIIGLSVGSASETVNGMKKTEAVEQESSVNPGLDLYQTIKEAANLVRPIAVHQDGEPALSAR